MAMKKCKECGNEISSSAKVCPNCGKKQKSIVKISILVIVILIIIIGIASSGGNTTTTSSDSSTNSSTTKSEKFTLVSDEMTTDSIGSCYIEGTIQNNTDKTYSYVQVTFNIYDKDGNQLGTAIDNINNLEANGVWKYKAMGLTSEKVATYKFVEITGY